MEYFDDNAKDGDFLKLLREEVKGTEESYPFTLHLQLKTIISNEDLFHDKSVLKKKLF